MREIGLFLKSLISHWAARVTGGVLVALMFVAERVGEVVIPKWTIALFVSVVGITWAAFLTWKDERTKTEQERERVRQLEGQLQHEREVATREPVIEVRDDVYWLLATAATRGLRQNYVRDASGAQCNALWIGETPIYLRDTQWFYDLVSYAVNRALFRIERGPGTLAIYHLSEQASATLRDGRRRRRPIVKPDGVLHEARSGQPVETPLPD